jgi:hypothetical protein
MEVLNHLSGSLTSVGVTLSLWIAVTHLDVIFVNLDLRTQFELDRCFKLEGNLQIILRHFNFSVMLS